MNKCWFMWLLVWSMMLVVTWCQWRVSVLVSVLPRGIKAVVGAHGVMSEELPSVSPVRSGICQHHSGIRSVPTFMWRPQASCWLFMENYFMWAFTPAIKTKIKYAGLLLDYWGLLRIIILQDYSACIRICRPIFYNSHDHFLKHVTHANKMSRNEHRLQCTKWKYGKLA